MRSVVPVLVVAAAFASGCGEKATPPGVATADVKGAPLRREKSVETPPEAPPIGDVDRGPPVPVPPVVVEPAPAPPPPVADRPEDWKSVSFDELAGFEFTAYASESKEKHEIPAKVLALAGTKIVVDGFMMPLTYESGGAKKFLLLKSQFGCCYGGTPKLNEWVEVTMEGGAVAEYVPHVLSTVWGTLEIKEESKDGAATGLYKMKGVRAELTEAK